MDRAAPGRALSRPLGLLPVRNRRIVPLEASPGRRTPPPDRRRSAMLVPDQQPLVSRRCADRACRVENCRSDRRMIPANARAMHPRAAHDRICTAALWPLCRCANCLPENPAGPSPAQDAAARSDPKKAGGGSYRPSIGASGAAPLAPAADRGVSPFTPIGGLSPQFSAVLDPAPKHLAAARHPSRECYPGGGPFLQEREG